MDMPEANDMVSEIAECFPAITKGEPIVYSKAMPNVIPKPSRTVQRPFPKIGRNDPCICGSGKKYKKCCINKVRRIR